MTAPATPDSLMTRDSVAPTVVGVGAAARMLPRLGARTDSILLIDAQILAQHPALGAHGRHVVTVDPDVEQQRDVLERARSVVRGESAEAGGGLRSSRSTIDGIIAIGGGSVMDAAKLLRLLLVSAASFRSVCHAAESFGVSMVPAGWARDAPSLALIPTTFGTGSEASAVACLHGEGSARARRLVTGSLMRADTVVLDPLLTRSLTDQALREGAAEVLLRVFGSHVGSPPSDVPDRAAEELVTRVAALADKGVRRGFDDGLRQALAIASGETHTGWALVGRDPYAAKHWYLANELSSAACLRKVPVTLRLMPEIWRRILDGDPRLGDGSRLWRLWGPVADILALPSDPVAGVQEWASSWGIPLPLPSREAAARAARRAFEVWGGERPALRGLSAADIFSIYVPASHSMRTGRSPSLMREEVNR